jgi:hypothetical protein
MNHRHGRSTERSRSAGALRWQRAGWIAAAAGGALTMAIVAVACSLGNIKRDDCVNDAQCAVAFGAGSTCSQGYCSPATTPNQGCESKNAAGLACFSCKPEATRDFENACTNAECAPFDNKKRLTKLPADGMLPPLP